MYIEYLRNTYLLFILSFTPWSVAWIKTFKILVKSSTTLQIPQLCLYPSWVIQ